MTTSTPATPAVKPWYKSKTVWLNVASCVLLVAALFVTGGQYASLLPPNVVEWIGVGVAVVNVILRFVTTVPIS